MSGYYDKLFAFFFCFLLLFFLFFMFANNAFFNWAFERHQNQASWFIRPIFLIPFCFFSYKKSCSGIMGTLLCLMTSMFWFPVPDAENKQINEFLQYEKQWLQSEWDLQKTFFILLVPAFLLFLGTAFWRRNIKLGLSAVVLIAFGKVGWSILFGGEAGKTVVIPAAVGLVVCLFFLYAGFNKLEQKQKKT